MNSTRTVFGKHRAGYVFPMLLSVKPMAGSFVGVIQQLQSEDQFILLTSLSRRIVGGTQDSIRLFGSVDFEDAVVTIDSLLSDSDFDALYKGMESAAARHTRRQQAPITVIPSVA